MADKKDERKSRSYEVLAGGHSEADEDGASQFYKKGDTITSKNKLIKLFGKNKFRLVDGDEEDNDGEARVAKTNRRRGKPSPDYEVVADND